MHRWWLSGFAATMFLVSTAAAGDLTSPVPAGDHALIKRGYQLLTNKSYLPPDFDQQVFEELWKTWEEPLRTEAEQASPEQRRQMAFSRYGLTESPERPGGVALQYVDDGRGGWVMNCLACHTGKVAGQTVLGAPNSLYDLQTLTEDVRNTKLRLGKRLSHMDLGSLATPLSGSIGTTNAVMFGVLLMNYRDPDLNVVHNRPPPAMLHHDHDAPPWWHYKRKTKLYIDGFAHKSHRPLMQFLLIPRNGPDKFRQWEDDFRAIEAWIESLEPPPYPFAIDRALAATGEQVYRRACADCHGTYGSDGHYPERLVAIEELGTDRTRLDAISPAARKLYATSWFGEYGAQDHRTDPGGYVAPPLDGIWASAPYLHNGSVPTLWHLLHPDQRPTVWQRSEDGYDRQRVGLQIVEADAVPAELRHGHQRRRWFDTRLRGKSAAGHDFPNTLTDDEKRAVLEYLKTL